MLPQVVVVERALQCKDCVYDEYGKLTRYCGSCEEKNISERIKWWQDGKKKLRERIKE